MTFKACAHPLSIEIVFFLSLILKNFLFSFFFFLLDLVSTHPCYFSTQQYLSNQVDFQTISCSPMHCFKLFLHLHQCTVAFAKSMWEGQAFSQRSVNGGRGHQVIFMVSLFSLDVFFPQAQILKLFWANSFAFLISE